MYHLISLISLQKKHFNGLLHHGWLFGFQNVVCQNPRQRHLNRKLRAEYEIKTNKQAAQNMKTWKITESSCLLMTFKTRKNKIMKTCEPENIIEKWGQVHLTSIKTCLSKVYDISISGMFDKFEMHPKHSECVDWFSYNKLH